MTHSASSDQSVTTPLSHIFTDALSRIDGCPNTCGNTEAPRVAIPAGNGWVASYLCADCGHAWTTSWRNDA